MRWIKILTSALFLPFLLANNQSTEPPAVDREKRRIAVPTPVADPVWVSNTLLASCEQSKFVVRDQNLCIRVKKQKSYHPDKPIRFEVSWGEIPDGASVVVMLNKLSVGSSNGTWGNPAREYISYSVPIATYDEFDGRKSISESWEVSGTNCIFSDTGPMCAPLKNAIRPGRYMLTASLMKDLTPAAAIADMPPRGQRLGPFNGPGFISSGTSRSFQMDGDHDWQFVDRDIHYAFRDHIASEIGDREFANRHYKGAPLFELIDNKFEKKNGELCGKYRLLDLLSGTIRVCLPGFYLTDYGLQPGRIDGRLVRFEGEIGFAKGLVPLQKAKDMATEQVGRHYASLVKHLSPPTAEQMGYIPGKSGDYLSWLKKNPEALDFLESSVKNVQYRQEDGGFWAISFRAKHVNASHVPQLGLPKTGFDDDVFVRVNSNGSSCIMSIKPHGSKALQIGDRKPFDCMQRNGT